MTTIDWLLDSDPAISWQAMRDLTDASPAAIAAERARIPNEGIGAQILASQGSDGPWHLSGEPDWLPTLYMLQLLRATGIDPANRAVQTAVSRLEAGYRWAQDLGAKPFFEGEVEPCINGGALAIGAYLGHPTKSLVDRLLREQLEDGGWNCDAPESSRSSFHSTICVLEGLLEYESSVGNAPEVADARKRAEEYLLKRSLLKRLSTGEVANPEFLDIAFPPRYHYDILRGLDYFRAADTAPDERMSAAIHILETKRPPDGRWPLDCSYDEAISIPTGESAGEPSRWNTLRALRVLAWFNRRPVEHASASKRPHQK